MKVLHINSFYSTSHFYKHFFDQQINQGLKIDVVVPVAFAFHSSFNHGHYSRLITCFNSRDRFLFSRKQSKILKAVESSYTVQDYDLIHAHSLFSNGSIAYKLHQKHGSKYIVAVRNTDINVFFKRMIHLRHLGLEILRHAEKIIFLSESYKHQLLNHYVPNKLRELIAEKTVVIPNGVDQFWIDNKSKKLDFDITGKEITLLQVGDINKNKNITLTIKAVQNLIKRGYKIRLNVVGKIKDNHLYEQMIKQNFVNYLGFLDKDKLLDVYRNSHIFVLPSIHETFGLVYLEAMSQGVPVIFTKDQGFDHQLPKSTVGLAVNPKDDVELSSHILVIMTQLEPFSRNCTEAIDEFSWQKIESNYRDIYERIVNKT